MANFPKGWVFQKSLYPQKISEFITSAQINDGSNTVDGEIIKSSNYFDPTEGGWGTSPYYLNGEPSVNPINATSFKNCERWALAMNSQIKFSNSDAPEPFKNYLFGISNFPNTLDYEFRIPMDFGGTSFNLIQLSLALNALGQGDEYGQVEVFDFGVGPYSGENTFYLTFGGVYGQIDLGWRFESTGGQSYLMHTPVILLPPTTDENIFPYIDIESQPHFGEPVPLEQTEGKGEKKEEKEKGNKKEKEKTKFGGLATEEPEGETSPPSSAFTPLKRY